jgi:histidinol dehydrogenase
VAAQRVRAFHERQVAESWEFTEADGTRLGQRVTPLDRAGLYVPGGKAAYPSSVLMNAVPAKVAGVKEVIMVVPTPSGVKNQMVLAAAHLAGVDRVFTIGGAQAVAALAYGTQTVPRVDKIVGPGNAYVAEAKRRVFGAVGIDMIAGPSEILVICDGSTNADWIAMDLFSQAEHDEMAQSILLSPSKEFLDNVQASIKRLMDTMPRATVIATSLKNRGRSLRAEQSNCARTPGIECARPGRLGRKVTPRRCHFHGALQQRIAGRLLRRPQPRVAHCGHGTVQLTLGCVRLSEAQQHYFCQP